MHLKESYINAFNRTPYTTVAFKALLGVICIKKIKKKNHMYAFSIITRVRIKGSHVCI